MNRLRLGSFDGQERLNKIVCQINNRIFTTAIFCLILTDGGKFDINICLLTPNEGKEVIRWILVNMRNGWTTQC